MLLIVRLDIFKMGCVFDRHPLNDSIIIGTYSEPFDPLADSYTAAEYLLDALKNSFTTMYYVADMRQLKVSFSDVMIGLDTAYKTPGSPYKHPNLKTFTVATDELIKMGAIAAAQQMQYGQSDVMFYHNIDEALKEIIMQVGKG